MQVAKTHAVEVVTELLKHICNSAAYYRSTVSGPVGGGERINGINSDMLRILYGASRYTGEALPNNRVRVRLFLAEEETHCKEFVFAMIGVAWVEQPPGVAP